MSSSTDKMRSDLTTADVLEARRRIAGLALRTPLVRADALSERLGSEVLLKLETLQPIGAFKIRGAANALLSLSQEQRRRGVVCASTGNHGRAVAWVARSLGIPATICLSALVPEERAKAIEALGARVRRVGRNQDEAMEDVAHAVANEGMTEVSPFDDPQVISGQGTIGLELLEERPDLEAILVPLSGGGLAGGIALAAKTLKPGIRMIGVSMEHGAAMHESIAAGRPVAVEEVPSLADSLGGGIGLANGWTFELCGRLLDETVLVSESEIYRGIRHLLLEERQVAEGAAAVGAAALLAGKIRPKGPTALVISGRNIGREALARIAAGQPVAVGGREISG
ncbi:MAG TPA: hydroxyectoine utilization dehydratase EutB [Stellaceae bacterium]|nr:hydroxyectoine utilization dehydratase EutB [Stellaceae bacterium]